MSYCSVSIFLLTILATATWSIDSEGYTTINKFNAKYKFHGAVRYFAYAVGACLSEKSEIFYPKSLEEAKIVFEQIVPKYASSVAIGIRRPSGSSTFKSIHGKKSIPFDLGLDNSGSLFASLDSSGKLRAVNYPENCYFICKRTINECPSVGSDYSYKIESLHSSYKYVSTNGYWRNKLFECLDDNAEIFYPQSADEARNVFNNVVPNGVDRITIGIHNWLNPSMFITMDGNAKFFSDWSNGEPKFKPNYMGVLTRNLKFQTNEDFISGSVCVKRKKQSCELLDSSSQGQLTGEINEDGAVENVTYIGGKTIISTTWNLAIKACKAINSMLVMPSSQIEVSEILNYFKEGSAKFKGAWLGFHNALESNYYADLTDNPLKHDSFKWVEDNAKNYKKGCGFVTSSGSLSVKECSLMLPYLCKSDIDFVDYPQLMKSYKLSLFAKTWYEARKSCQECGAQLAMPMDMDEFNLLIELMKSRESIFIGFHSIFDHNEDVVLNYMNPIPDGLKWKNKNHDETKLCGVMDEDGLYKDNCDSKHYFICEKDYDEDENPPNNNKIKNAYEMIPNKLQKMVLNGKTQNKIDKMISKESNLVHYHWVANFIESSVNNSIV